MARTLQNEGEGDQTAAKAYDRAAAAFANTDRVAPRAARVVRAIEGPANKSLIAAENVGRTPPKAEDLLLCRST